MDDTWKTTVVSRVAQAAGLKEKKRVYENTYRLGPTSLFRVSTVEHIIQDLLDFQLKDQQYNHTEAVALCLTLATEIKNRVKEFKFDRYKLVAFVAIAQRQENNMLLGSRCCWNTNMDRFASYKFENYHIVASATVFACYHE